MLDSSLLWLQHAHFIRPWWLLALLPVAGLVITLWLRKHRAGQWRAFIAPHLLNYLIDGTDSRRRRAPLLGLAVLWILAVIALAGPAWEKLPQPVQKSGSALIILWDMSPSMMAQDLKPSRLMRSRLKLTDLLRARREGITGLIAYAGESHVVTPLTDDTDTIISLLSALSPATMPLPGSNPEMALRSAHQLFDNAGIVKGNVLIITDGIVPEAFDTLARIQNGSQHQLTLWGVGTSEGAPIPLPRGGFAKEPNGSLVNARLNEDQLQDFAADIGAYYVPLLAHNEDIETLQTLFQAPGDNLRESDRVFDAWYEHGPWLLLLMLPFVALLYRRGWLMCLPLFVLPLAAPKAEAGFWDDLWKTPNQQGQEALAEQQPETAAQLFEDPAWRGTALYRAGDYSAALEAFEQNEPSSDALYNQGNSLMHLGELKDAIDAYKQALEQNPDNADAAANLKLAQRMLKQQQQQQQNKKDGDQQQGSKQASSDGEQQNKQGEQQQNQSDSQNAADNGGQQPYDDPNNNQQAEQDAQADAGEQQDAENAPDEKKDLQNNAQQQEQKKDQGNQQQQLGEESGEQSDKQGDTMSASLTPAEQREQQEALEQWLRKVPDDPSGLMRNKFQHQYRERRQSGNWQPPDNDARHRW